MLTRSPSGPATDTRRPCRANWAATGRIDVTADRVDRAGTVSVRIAMCEPSAATVPVILRPLPGPDSVSENVRSDSTLITVEVSQRTDRRRRTRCRWW